MDAKRKKVLRRIEALRNKTVDAGCTEEEAIAASVIVGKLMDEFNLSMSDVEINQISCIQNTIQTKNKRNNHPIYYCLMALAEFCDVEVWRSIRRDNKEEHVYYTFFGLPKDVDIAVYLYHTIYQALEREVQVFHKDKVYTDLLGKGEKKIATNSFLYAMGRRISARLYAMKKERQETVFSETGRDLVLVKGSVVKNALEKLHIIIGAAKKSYHKKEINLKAMNKGYEAGDHVSFHKGVVLSTNSSDLQFLD